MNERHERDRDDRADGAWIRERGPIDAGRFGASRVPPTEDERYRLQLAEEMRPLLDSLGRLRERGLLD